MNYSFRINCNLCGLKKIYYYEFQNNYINNYDDNDNDNDNSNDNDRDNDNNNNDNNINFNKCKNSKI